MKKLFLLPLVAIGLALVPMKQADAGFRLESARAELDSVTPHTGTATTDIRVVAITRVAITAITAVIHITERIITMVGPITAAIDITSITSVTTTAVKAIG